MSVIETPWPSLVGHDWAVDMLSGALANGRLAHAYLFTGPAHVGKTTLARAFAQLLNCDQGGTAPCMECRSCQLIAKDGHPDVRLLQPVLSGSGRSETFRIDQVRNLQKELALAPYEGRYRVAILTRFQAASSGAANALLKTLEEPADRVVLLLTADEGDSLLPTIVSRCQVLALRPLALEKAEAALLTRWRASEKQARELAHLSGGRIGLAVRMLSEPEILALRREWLDGLETLLQEDRTARFQYAEKLARQKKGQNVRDALAIWLSWWRDVMLLAGCQGDGVVVTNIDRYEHLASAAQRYGLKTASEAVHAMQQTLWQLDRNANVRLALEVLMLNLPVL